MLYVHWDVVITFFCFLEENDFLTALMSEGVNVSVIVFVTQYGIG